MLVFVAAPEDDDVVVGLNNPAADSIAAATTGAMELARIVGAKDDIDFGLRTESASSTMMWRSNEM